LAIKMYTFVEIYVCCNYDTYVKIVVWIQFKLCIQVFQEKRNVKEKMKDRK
jgi:hypothetical protein